METAKEIIAYFISPLVIFFVLQVFSFLCAILQRHGTSTVLSLGSIAMLFITSIPILTTDALEKMENQYPPLTGNKLAAVDAPTIVVLGTGYNPRKGFPANNEVSPHFLARLVEGVRVSRSLPEARLIIFVSGAQGSDEEKEGFIDSICEILSVEREKVDLITTARSTAAEARLVQAKTSEPIVLVTSARHMPRAMNTFRSLGLEPTASYSAYFFSIIPFSPHFTRKFVCLKIYIFIADLKCSSFCSLFIFLLLCYF